MDRLRFATWLDSLDFDLANSEPYGRVLPGLAEAFDDERMKATLSGVLFDPSNTRYTIEACEAGKGFFHSDFHCRIQYELKIRDHAAGQVFDALVNASLFPDLAACRDFYTHRVLPLVGRMAGRPEIAPFDQPSALIEPLFMAASVFPIDGELPVLIDATDCEQLMPILQDAVQGVDGGNFLIQTIRQDLAHYGRALRCVLRFRLEGENTASGQPRRLTVYGKVDADDLGSKTVAVVSAMQGLLDAPGAPFCFSIPQTLCYLPDRNMLLMTELPGEVLIKRLNKQLEKGAEPVVNGISIEEAVEYSAKVLATLHKFPIDFGPRRAFVDEIASLQEEIDVVMTVYPDLGRPLNHWLEQINQAGQALPPMPLCLCNGDYTNAQLLFNGHEVGLVDFDTVCQGEPGLDIGQFLAYQRLSFEKGQGSGDPALKKKNEQICDRFLNAYIDSAGYTGASASQLREWVKVYETIGLMHLVLHSWQKFKGKRLRLALQMLEERLERLG